MAEQVTKLKVFVASPGDVTEERGILKEVIEELNHGVAAKIGLVLQYVGWDTDAWAGIGEDAQDVINQQIGSYDIFIGIMWKRFGTPTNRAGSGTEEEFEQAYKLWSSYGRPQIMLYFRNEPFFLLTVEETGQMANVINFKNKAEEKGALYFAYKTPQEFEKLVRQHLTEEIFSWEKYEGPGQRRPSNIPRLPHEFYRVLYNELDIFITQFEQLQRDYSRELRGEQLEFAVDFSEVHDYMYPSSLDSPRAYLNQYIFNTIENPLTLMPGAVGELLTDLDRALPAPEVLKKDPMITFKKVAVFVNNFPRYLNNEEKIIDLYIQAESELLGAWGELFTFVIQGEYDTPFQAIKTLIDLNKLTPIAGVQEITAFPTEVQEKAQWMRNRLNLERPGRFRNNLVDAIDFAVTWLLNSQMHRKDKRYLTIYTQSKHFINICTTNNRLRWQDDYLVRGAHYFKFRTRLQELTKSTQERYDYVTNWAKKCRELQKEIPNLSELEEDQYKLKKPTLSLLDRYREFDEECRIPLSFTGEGGKWSQKAVRDKASQLYDFLKQRGEFRGKTGEAFELFKTYLKDLKKQLELFTPEKAHAPDSRNLIENIAKWLKPQKGKEN